MPSAPPVTLIDGVIVREGNELLVRHGAHQGEVGRWTGEQTRDVVRVRFEDGVLAWKVKSAVKPTSEGGR